ncbi:Uncharacterized protein T01_3330 [Trichinella spiralis]|uniref:Reverse transcriptase domain-containing protein n=1 Tax=Trichinella spiralis TaxID=6334 RepID=A0A0V1BUA1_TRISP|nr:Uncharacterized protein T01_3330 [Trichinella spiralis]
MLPAQQSTESVQMMGTATFPIDAHHPFNPEEGTWDTWILQFRSYPEINFISDSNLMRRVMTIVSPIINYPLHVSHFTYDECVVKMKELYGRRVILMHERANFFRITQTDHQTPKQFANSLREAAGHCILETFNTEAALVLQFINGMKNEEIQLRLLAKENINLDEALSFLEIPEAFRVYVTAVEKHDILQENASSKAQSVSSVGSKAIWQKCNSWKDHKLYADGIYAVKERAHNFEVTVKINGKSTRMELDTGTAVTIFHGARGEPKRGDDGDGRRQHRYEKAIVRVAKNGVTNVMGQDWINAFRAAETLRSLLANKKEVNAVESRTQNDVCAEFPVVFEDGLQHCTKISLGCPYRHGKNPNGKIRICADFSIGLNDRLMVDSYPILRPENLYQALRGGKTFSKLDLSEAYLQVELDEESKRILVINTHKGLYHYNRLPFGVASAPAIFQKVMDTMLAGIPNVAAYLDDIILTGATDDEHRRTLKLVLGRLKEFGLRIHKEKCIFFQREVEYLGHILSSKVTQERRALELDRRAHKSGGKRKRLLNSPLLLTHYHPEWPIVLAADTSNEGIGAVVYHRLSDGTVKVIAHASKTLSAAQRNHGQIEKEALALVYGVKKFHKYLWGRRFTLLTDHKPLVSIFGSKKVVPQMAACHLTRWAIALMNYSFDIEYRSMKNFCQADCLSRLPSSSDELFEANFDHREAEDELTVKQLIVELQAELPVTARVIAEATEKGSVLKQVKQFVLSGWPEKCPREELRSYFIKRTELSVSYGCLLWGIRTVIPMKLRSRVLMKLHETHPGRERMPAMNKDIEMKAQSCEGCATAQKNPAKMAVKPWEVADRP